jgi:hypothetical protein
MAATAVRTFRTLPKDVGVIIVLLIALALGWGLRATTANRSTSFTDDVTKFSLSYPATWGKVESLKGLLIKLEDPRAASVFKTSLTVDTRALDPQNPPTLQALVDRRVAQNGNLTGYHLIALSDATVASAKAQRLEYAYAVQPIDQPRRASLPVVVHAIEYIIIAKENAFYVTLAAAESDFENASMQFDQILKTVKVP